MPTTALINILLQYRYIIIVPLTLVEGSLVMMTSGFLLRLGYFSFWPLYFSLMLGDLLGDIFWYWLGRYQGHRFVKKFGKYFSINEPQIQTIERLFHKYHNSILIISKITMGFGFALITLFTAGLVKIPFKKYLALNFFGQFIWTGLLMAVGYYLGNFYVTINNELGLITTIGLILIVFFALVGFGKYVKKRVLSTKEQ